MAGKRLSNPRSIAIIKPYAILLVFCFSVFAIYFVFSSQSTDPKNPRPLILKFHEAIDFFFSSPNMICSPSSSSSSTTTTTTTTRLPYLNRNADSFDGSKPIRVYVYAMPSKFTCDLLRLYKDTYKETTNLTSNGSPVHRLIDQHSIDYWLWADLIAPESERLLKNVKRVYNQEEADLFYIPFFTTITFFLFEEQECKALYREALKWVTDQPAWKKSQGRDHILPIHHPWSFKTVRKFMKKSIWLLPDLDSTGKWYKPGHACLAKDVILPYVPNFEVCDAKCLSQSQSKRTTLLFFRGRTNRNAGGKIRKKLGSVLSGVRGVVFEEGTTDEDGKKLYQTGMRRSKFCLSPAGDTPSSSRLFEAIVSGCIPVVVSDELDPPFADLIDYNKMALFVKSNDALKPGWLVNYLKGIDSAKLRDMQENLAKNSKHFIYSSPALPFGPEDLTWQMIGRKLPCIRRSERIDVGPRCECTCDCMRRNISSTRPSLL